MADIKKIAYNIDWDVDMDEVYEHLDEMTCTKAAEALELSKERYANMTTGERHDYAYDKFRHCPAELDEFLGLPDEVTLPDDVEEEDAADWLSDTYGYCINGLDIRPEFVITLDAVHDAYRKGIARLVESPNEDGVVCQIGDYWFCFGGQTAEGATVDSYKADIPENDIVREIYDAVTDIGKNLDADEYNYYATILKEGGCLND